MIIYLYVKQHKITGLKYFGKTTKKDPYGYNGSGLHWRRHIKKHGNEIETLNVWEFDNIDECEIFAVNFSKENNIVESTEWANMKIENGKDGGPPSAESILKMIETRKKNGNFRSPEHTAKLVASKHKNGTTGKGKKKSVEHVRKIVEIRKANNSYGHKQTKESIQKMIETKKQKNNLTHSKESYFKAWETRRRNKNSVVD